MTPFRNDTENPFDRQSLWPRLPQRPLAVVAFRGGANGEAMSPPVVRFETLADEDDDRGMAWFDSRAHFDADGPRPYLPATAVIALRPTDFTLRPAVATRRELRLTPLIAAAAVGTGGLLALFLLIGFPPEPAAPPVQAPVQVSSGLWVGALVAAPAPAAPAEAAPALPIKAPPAAAATLGR